MSPPSPAPGAAETARVDRLAAELAERKLDALLVNRLVNIRYLTGFTGSNALALIKPPGAARGDQRFLTDFRYDTQSAAEVSACFTREIFTGELLDAAVVTLLEATASGAGRLGFDDASLTVAQHAHLRQELPPGWQLVPCAGAVERLRAVKEPGEVARIHAAAQLADQALRNVLERGLIGRTEHELALDLDYEMRRLGAHGPSFPTIVAAGAHGALPHAQPRSAEPIPRDVLVTIDWGAFHEGYCSDCTRTYATGERLPEPARAIYALVLAALTQGLDAARAGPSGRELDAVAREVIERAGHGEHFGHGLGHGVGLEIHEGPRLSRTASEDPLLAGNIVTVEPGVYVPGQCGVRIEELALLTADGCQVLTGLPTELTVVA